MHASGVDKTVYNGYKETQGRKVGYCDDNPFSVGQGQSIVIDRSDCNSDGIVFVRKGFFKPRCQNWSFHDDESITWGYDPDTGDVWIPNKIVERHDCDQKENVIVTPGAGSYTVGTWSKNTGSRVSWCVVSG